MAGAPLPVAPGSSNYLVTLRVTDNGTPPLNDSEQITIRVVKTTLNAQLLTISNLWKYDQSAADLGSAWRQTNYNDAAWPQGAALFYNENALLPAPTNTPLALSNGLRPIITYYFRTRFHLAADPAGVTLTASNVLDDGAVFYLNGAEPGRSGMDAGPVTSGTLATNTVGNATYTSMSLNAWSKKELGSSGGTSIQQEPLTVSSDIKITPEEVILWTREIETEVWRKTGAVHCSVLFCDGKCIVKSCDVGRHNTVDKVVGHAILNKIDLSRCVIGCTGWQPAGMVKKCANAGIPVVISRAASTDRGIAAAESAGITLVCFSRENRFTIYTHPNRILGS